MKIKARITRVTQKILGVLSLLAIVCCSSTSDSPDISDISKFTTTWKVNGNNLSIQIPISTDATYNYTVEWGDGKMDSGQTGFASHTYAEAGEYDVKITGDFPRIFFNNTGDRLKIIAIKEWGPIVWSSMGNSFYGCSNLEGKAIDTPVLSNVTNFNSMFHGATKFNQDIGNWDISKAQYMDSMFRDATSFNQNIGNWKTSNVTSMTYMFSGANSFNQNIRNWKTSAVTNMRGMFSDNTVFNQNIGNWDTSNVTVMAAMFSNNTAFNQNISGWVLTDLIGAGVAGEDFGYRDFANGAPQFESQNMPNF